MDTREFLQRFHHLRNIQEVADYPELQDTRPAAVLIPVIEHQQQLTLLFTQRAFHLKHHAGQISFPGGKQEDNDANLLDTALREAQEEIGLNREQVKVIGQLKSFRTISGFEVTPYVGLVQPPVELIMDANEVANTFEVPLRYFLQEQNYIIHIARRKNKGQPVYFIPWQDRNIWGATAAFVRSLALHLGME